MDTLNRGEAEKQIIIAREEMLNKLCPIWKSKCMPTCMCFTEGSIVEVNIRGEKGFRYYTASCKSPLISGVIEVEGINLTY